MDKGTKKLITWAHCFEKRKTKNKNDLRNSNSQIHSRSQWTGAKSGSHDRNNHQMTQESTERAGESFEDLRAGGKSKRGQKSMLKEKVLWSSEPESPMKKRFKEYKTEKIESMRESPNKQPTVVEVMVMIAICLIVL